MRATLSQKYFGCMLLLITVAGNDRYERLTVIEIRWKYITSIMVEKLYRYESESGLEICEDKVESHNGS